MKRVVPASRGVLDEVAAEMMPEHDTNTGLAPNRLHTHRLGTGQKYINAGSFKRLFDWLSVDTPVSSCLSLSVSTQRETCLWRRQRDIQRGPLERLREWADSETEWGDGGVEGNDRVLAGGSK